jgi:hypothetical protein
VISGLFVALGTFVGEITLSGFECALFAETEGRETLGFLLSGVDFIGSGSTGAVRTREERRGMNWGSVSTIVDPSGGGENWEVLTNEIKNDIAGYFKNESDSNSQIACRISHLYS